MTFATVSTPPALLARLLSAFQHDPRTHPRLLGPRHDLSTASSDELRGAHPLGAALQGERTSFDAPPCPLPAPLSQTPFVIAGPSWQAGNAYPSVPLGFTQRPRPRFSIHPAKGAQPLQTRRLPPPPSGTSRVNSQLRVAPDSANPPGCFHLARLAMPLLPEKGGLPRRALLRSF